MWVLAPCWTRIEYSLARRINNRGTSRVAWVVYSDTSSRNYLALSCHFLFELRGPPGHSPVFFLLRLSSDHHCPSPTIQDLLSGFFMWTAVLCVPPTLALCSPSKCGAMAPNKLWAFPLTLFILTILVQSHYLCLRVLNSLLTALVALVTSSPFCSPMSDSFSHSVSDDVTSV